MLPDAVVIFDDNSPTVLRQWIVPDRGRYRIRISAAAYQAAGRPVWLKLYATDFKTQRLLGYFDLPADQPREMEVVAHLDPGALLNLSPFDTNYDDQGRGNYWGSRRQSYPGRGVAIKWVEVEGPLLERWPPPSVGRLFGDLPVEPIETTRVASAGPGVRDRAGGPARGGRANVCETSRPGPSGGRSPRPTSSVMSSWPTRDSTMACRSRRRMRVAFRAVLTSPRFLFLEEQPGGLDDWALASRLSYFLWSTLPDDELRQLAAEGRLQRPGGPATARSSACWTRPKPRRSSRTSSASGSS